MPKSKIYLLTIIFSFLLFFSLSESVFAASSDLYVEGEAIVLLKSDTNTALTKTMGENFKLTEADAAAAQNHINATADKANAVAAHTYDALSLETGNLFVLMKSKSETTDELLARLEKDPNVISVSPNHIFSVNKVPNDPRYSQMWAMPAINAPSAWDRTTGSANKHVAVLDTGILSSHEDLRDNFAASLSVVLTGEHSYNDGHGHGTHVSGTIGAQGNNGVGVTGVNWTTRIIAVKVMDNSGNGTSDTIMRGLNYVLSVINGGVDVAAVNMSVGGWHQMTPAAFKSLPYYAAFEALARRTVIVVAAGNEGLPVGAPVDAAVLRGATGNSNYPAGSYYVYPASFIDVPNMIVVGATDSSSGAARFTNWSNTRVDILAPGVNILSTTNGGSYGFMQGTSMAAPHVAGAVALLASANPSMTPNQLKQALLSSANGSVNPTTGPRYKTGNAPVSARGLLDVGKAMDNLPGNPLNIITASLPGGRVGSPYNATLTATVFATWSVDSGALPDGLKLSPDGLISGSPTKIGSYNFTIKASSGNRDVKKDFSITINPATASSLPSITKQPANQTVRRLDDATFTMEATGDNLSYQWQINTGTSWADIQEGFLAVGTRTNTLLWRIVSEDEHGYRFRCRISNDAGSIDSNAAELLVAESDVTITRHPESRSVKQGQTVSFSVEASSTTAGSLTYQWWVWDHQMRKWLDSDVLNPEYYSGIGTGTLSLRHGASLGDNTDEYYCIVHDSGGYSATSNTATLTVGGDGSDSGGGGGGGCDVGVGLFRVFIAGCLPLLLLKKFR